MYDAITEPGIRLNGVTILYDGTPAIQGISFEIPMGSTLAIMGPSGCGKSTLLKACAGIVPPDAGEIEVLSMDIVHADERELRALRRRSGFVFQDAALWQNLSVRQNLALPVEYHHPNTPKDDLERRIDRLLGEIGFVRSLDIRPAQLSSGEQKIVSFARSLVADPEILFMDEPTSFVDNDIGERLIRKIRNLKEKRRTLIIATHSATVTSLAADYILVLKKGRSLAFGTTDQIVHSTNPEVVSILSDVLSETATYANEILNLLERGAGDFFGTDSIGTDSIGTDSIGTDSIGTDSIGTDSIGTDSVSSDAGTGS